jgi:small-conductance mechanosensitive channel
MKKILTTSVIAVFLIAFASASSAQMSLSGGSQAQEDTSALLDQPLSEAQANALISRLSDQQVRAVLLGQMALRAAENDGTDDADLSNFIYHATTGAMQTVTVPITRLPLLFQKQAEALSTFVDKLGWGGVGRFVVLFAVVLLIAAAVEWAFRYATRRWHELPPPDPDTQSLRQPLTSLVQRLCRDVMAVFVFIIAAVIATRLIFSPQLQVYASLIGPNLIALPRLAWAFSRFVMAPGNPQYRIVQATDRTAQASVVHAAMLAIFVGISAVIVQFNALNGVPMGETRIGFWLNAFVHFYLAINIWRYRHEMVDMMRGPAEVTLMEDRVARAFPIFAIVASLGTWWLVNMMVSYGNFELLEHAPHYVTLALLIFAPAMDTAIRGLVRHMVPAMSGAGAVAERAHLATVRSYIRIGRVIVFGMVLITLARVWGVDPSELAAAGLGERLAAGALEFSIIISVGYLVYEAASLYINHKLAAEFTASGYDPENAEFGGDGGGVGGSRLSTVLPLVLMVVRAAIIVIFVLLALGNVGVDTTPLLAGAGIVGLAIGFGAQKLVTDVVSGVFFLIDDAFRTAEYVEIEGTMGTVEKISLRSLQLRHHKGPVHTIPYGEIPKITNFSRDWVIMKLRFTVPFGTDPNQVKKIFKKIGQEMIEMEEFKDDFLQPFKSQGVLEVDDVGIVIRGKFMCKPGTQFMIRKEIFNRVNAAFAENGLEFARREVRVALPNMDKRGDLSEQDKATIAAAATQAAQEQLAEKDSKDDR